MKPNHKKTTPIARLEAAAERMLFAHRKLWLLFFAIVSVLMLWQASLMRPDASYSKMVPLHHPFLQNYLKYENELRPLGNTIRISVETTKGDIYSAEYIDLLKKITEEVFYIPGIDRGNLRSLTTANTLWIEATEEGMRGGVVTPPSFNGSPEDVAKVHDNVIKANLIGQLVGNDQKSSTIYVPLLEKDPESGANLDYGLFSDRLEKQVRDKYASKDIKIHVVGFAKLVGDLIAGAADIGVFFALTILLTSALVFLYSRCWKSTVNTIGCCLLAVVWHVGTMHMLGFGLDPYSILVPFLTFAIGVSHAMQNVNTLASQSLAGASRIDAARATFRLLFIPGTIALVCNVVGFSTMLVIDIGVIRELAISASVGVGVIIFTKMFLLPILMSYGGLSKAGLEKAKQRDQSSHRLARAISALTIPKYATVTVALAAILAAVAFHIRSDLQIGDLEAGAPELRPNSTYNKDMGFFTKNYATSSDVFVIMVETDPDKCSAYPVATLVNRLQWVLEETEGVQGTMSMFNIQQRIIASGNGGLERWATTSRNRFITSSAQRSIPPSYYKNDCSMLPVLAYLADHKAGTLDRVVATIEKFKQDNPSDKITITLAAGNSGIEAATNSVVHAAWIPMLLLVYGIVAVLLLMEFRSIKVMLCIIIPLVISSILCEAIMTLLGLGVKVATLPVITLGVGIGVDYGIYLYNRLEGYLERGMALREAYFMTMRTTGIAIAFTGVTLGAGVLTWIFSDIKFQADMGLLLTFMFLWNMIGAVLLIPALASVLKVHAGHQLGGSEFAS